MIRKQADEIMLLKLIKTYCLSRLLYGCDICPTETLYMRELDIIWNNGFKHILTAAGVTVSNHFSSFAIPCHYRLQLMKDSCCSSVNYNIPIITFCIL